MKLPAAYQIALYRSTEGKPYGLHVSGVSFGMFRTVLAARRRAFRHFRTSQAQSAACALRLKTLSA